MTIIGPDFVESGVYGRNDVQGVTGPEKDLFRQRAHGKFYLPENTSRNRYQ